jgi:hypothetical protein
MNWKGMLLVAAFTQTGVWGSDGLAPESGTVPVCLEMGTEGVLLIRARAQASAMFAQIGVKLEWHNRRTCPPGSIFIEVRKGNPQTRFPGVLGYAYPYGGDHVVLLADRIRQTVGPGEVPALTAHVLVHELTHILEGTNRHSETGLMKAQWNIEDFSNMAWRPLPFTPMDIVLVDAGLKARGGGLLARR